MGLYAFFVAAFEGPFFTSSDLTYFNKDGKFINFKSIQFNLKKSNIIDSNNLI